MILHMIWTMVKVLGILLLVLLGILLFLILVVLLDPVCYQAEGKKEEKTLEGEARISWLFRLIQVKAGYAGQKGSFDILLLGIPLSRIQKWRTERKKKKRRKQRQKAAKKAKKKSAIKKTEKLPKEPVQTEKKPTETEKAPERTEKKPTETEKAPERTEKKTTETEKAPERIEKKTEETEKVPESAEKKTAETGKKPEQTKKEPERTEEESREEKTGFHPGAFLLRKIRGFWQKLKKMQLTWDGICDKIKQWYAFFTLQTTREAISFLKAEAGILLRHVMPRRMQGHLHFGFEDPAITGQVLAFSGICYPLYKENLQVIPDFEGPVLEGHLKLRGHAVAGFLLWHAWKVYRKKEVKEIWKKFREKEE